MRALLAPLLVAGICSLMAAPAASADVVVPESAGAFRDSVGVVTHAAYYDTAYGDWPRVVARLRELGVRHLREGVYANPNWRDWNERYYQAVELAAAHGVRFNLGLNPPGSKTGTLAQILRVVSGRLRHAVEALEAPNEFDKYVGGPRWPSVLAAYGRDLHRQAKAQRSLRSLPIVGPSFATPDGPGRLGDQRAWLDVGNVHPYTGGLSPSPEHVRSELARAGVTAPTKPVWATEAGFHNALNARHPSQPAVSEHAAAVYLLRTFLEHFRGGIERTYAYELIDEKPDRARRDPEQHFGLLRHDFTPKPAFTALRNLLALVGRGERRASLRPLRPLRLSVSARDRDVRRLVLQRGDGTYVVALWRLDSVWDRDLRRPLRIVPRTLVVDLPGARRVAIADPVRSDAERVLRLRHGRVRFGLSGRPLLLNVTPKHLLG